MVHRHDAPPHAAEQPKRIADGLTIEAGDPGDQSAAQGLTTLVMRKVFSPEAINTAANDVAIA